MVHFAAPGSKDLWSRIVVGGLLTGIVDGTFSGVLAAFFYGSTVERLFQGVAATVLGPSAMSGGAGTFAMGLLMHFGVALGWTIVLMAGLLRLAFVRRVLHSPAGAWKVAAVYGPLIWMTMSLVVIPVLTQRAPTGATFGARWWIQWFGHVPFVAFPMAWCARGLWRSGRLSG